MTVLLYIFLVAYIPILDKYIPRTSFGAGLPDLSAARLAGYLLILLFILEIALIRKKILLANKWIFSVVFFAGFAFLSISWSSYSYSLGIAQSFFDSVFMSAIIAVIGFNIFREHRHFELYAKNMVVASVIMSAVAIFQLAAGSSVIHGFMRSTGTFTNPNTLAIFLVLTIPCINYCMDKEIIPKTMHWMVYAMVAGGLVTSVSRKGIITATIAFGMHFWFNNQKRKLIFLSISCALLVVIFSSVSFVSQRFSQDYFSNSLEGKQSLVMAGLKMIPYSPIIGWGYNGYYSNLGKFSDIMGDSKQYDAHNMYITVLVDYGIVGFIPFIAIFAIPLMQAKRYLSASKMGKNNNERSFDFAVFGIETIIPYMINGYFAGGILFSNFITSIVYTQIMVVLNQQLHQDETIKKIEIE